MTHTLMALGLAALVQSTDTATFADAATEALIVQARHRHAYQDSLVRDYSAMVRTRIDVGFGRSRFARVSPIVVHETAARISWSLPNDLKVDVLGQRAASVFPSADIEAELDRPWFIPRSLGDSIRMVDDELPTTAALHPLAPGADPFYRYAITDSLIITVPGRTVRAVGVRVEPKVLGPSLIAGNVWFDADTYEVVRLRFAFVGQYTWVGPDGSSAEDSADARRGNVWAQRIAKLEADLEYALYDRVYWMPYRQLLRITVEIPWFLNVKLPIRFMTTFGAYDVNRSVLPKFAVALDGTLEQTDFGEHRRRRRSGPRCPEVATATDSASVSCVPGGRLDIAAFRDVREVEPWISGLGFGSSLNAILAGNDDADYYLATGGGVSFSSYGRGLLRNAELGLLFERQQGMVTVASSGVNDRLGGNGVFPLNSPVAEGDFVRAYVRRRSFVGPVELQ